MLRDWWTKFVKGDERPYEEDIATALREMKPGDVVTLPVGLAFAPLLKEQPNHYHLRDRLPEFFAIWLVLFLILFVLYPCWYR